MKKDIERMKQVEKWAQYVREHDDIDWSSQQKALIDSQIKNARNIRLSKKQVDYIRKKTKPGSGIF